MTRVPYPRIHGLDALRGILMMLGIVLHAVPAYQTGEGWVRDPFAQAEYLGLISAWIHYFRMPAFFAIAGFFGALLWVHRGPRLMWVNRFQRLVLPFLVFVVLLWPAVLLSFSVGGAIMDGHSDPVAAMWHSLGESLFPPTHLIHLWFLYDLILISIVVAGFALLFRRYQVRGTRWLNGFRQIVESPSRCVLGLGLLNGLWMWSWGWEGLPTSDAWIPDPIILSYYLLWYTGGWLFFYAQCSLSSLEDKSGWFLALSVVFTLLYMGMKKALEPLQEGGGAAWETLVFLGGITGLDPILEGLIMAGMGIGMLAAVRGISGVFLRMASSGSAAWRYVSDAAYWVYLIHLPLCALVPAALVGLDLPVGLKFPLAVLWVTLLCLVTYDFGVRATAIGRFLNGRRYPRRWGAAGGLGCVLLVGGLVVCLGCLPPITPPSPWSEGQSPAQLLPDIPIQHPFQPATGAEPSTRCVGIDHYVFCAQRRTEPEAREQCQDWGGTLVVLETPEENQRVSRLFSRLAPGPFWLGISDASEEGTWRWSDGSPLTYNAWLDGQPDDHGAGEGCALSNWKGVEAQCDDAGDCVWNGEPERWNDCGCRARFFFVCESESAQTVSLDSSGP